jgi:dCMP deaminase
MMDESDRCSICGAVDPELIVDHDHETGEIRGLLCYSCNIALGYYEKDRFLVDLFEAYLERHGSRVGRSEVFLQIAYRFARRSTCPRKPVGAVIVRDNRVIAHGYNGAPPGQPHCTEVGCDISPITGGCQRALHAEMNAITYASRKGVAVEGSIAFLTLSPCLYCARFLVVAGVAEVLFHERYRDESGVEYLKNAGVRIKGLK